MKLNFNGAPPRLRRFRRLMNMLVIAALVMVTLAPSASVPGATLVDKCYPTNDTFSGALLPLFNKFFGSIAGMFGMIVAGLIIVAVLRGLFSVARDKEVSGIIRVLVGIVSLPFIGIVALIIFDLLFVTANDFC